jgi:hypothetical protein
MQQDPLLEQLDWFFTSVNWTNKYPNTLVLPMAKPISDHIPCKVVISTNIPKSKVFRFENFWPEISGFLDTVKSSWSSQPVNKTNPASILAAKFKTLKQRLKSWSRQFSNLQGIITKCNKVILFFDCLEDCRPLSGSSSKVNFYPFSDLETFIGESVTQ